MGLYQRAAKTLPQQFSIFQMMAVLGMEEADHHEARNVLKQWYLQGLVKRISNNMYERVPAGQASTIVTKEKAPKAKKEKGEKKPKVTKEKKEGKKVKTPKEKAPKVAKKARAPKAAKKAKATVIEEPAAAETEPEAPQEETEAPKKKGGLQFKKKTE